MHTQKRYATCPKGMKKKESAKKREKMHTQRRYATCPKGMTKKKMHAQRRYATCPQYMLKEKEKRRKKNIAHVQEKNTGREINHAKEFIHYPPKIFHTLAPLDQIV